MELSCTLPFLAYIIGSSLVDLSIKIESTIRTSINRIIKMNIHNKLLVPDRFPYTLWVIHATIDENINIDIPFETHFSVINSHSRINKTHQTVIAIADNNRVVIDVSITLPHSK